MIDVVIPAYNCAGTIGATVRAFRDIGRVIVVDDMSADDTATKALMNGAHVVRGKGSR